jgi:hypothetical protein
MQKNNLNYDKKIVHCNVNFENYITYYFTLPISKNHRFC